MAEKAATAKNSSERVHFTVPADQAGNRLDRFLASQLPEMSRTHIQSLMDEGRVLVDGSAMKPSHRIEPGAIVVVEIPPPPAPGVPAEDIPLEIRDYDVQRGEYPASIDECDAYLITGSRESVYDDQPWIHRLAEFVR